MVLDWLDAPITALQCWRRKSWSPGHTKPEQSLTHTDEETLGSGRTFTEGISMSCTTHQKTPVLTNPSWDTPGGKDANCTERSSLCLDLVISALLRACESYSLNKLVDVSVRIFDGNACMNQCHRIFALQWVKGTHTGRCRVGGKVSKFIQCKSITVLRHQAFKTKHWMCRETTQSQLKLLKVPNF